MSVSTNCRNSWLQVFGKPKICSQLSRQFFICHKYPVIHLSIPIFSPAVRIELLIHFARFLSLFQQVISLLLTKNKTNTGGCNMSSLLIKNADAIVTCDSQDAVLEHANLLMQDGIITYIGIEPADRRRSPWRNGMFSVYQD